MAAFLYLCTFILGANYLFGVDAQLIEEEILNGADKNAIVGGEPIQIDQAPYLAQLIEDDTQICGSSILNEYWIVTAAHCVVLREDDVDYSIVTGSTFRSKGGNRHEIEKIIVHESYDLKTMDNDIALIKLKNRIKFDSKQKPISISKKLPTAKDAVTVAGWGKIGTYKRTSRVLLSTVVPVIAKSKCQEQYLTHSDRVTKNMFCAGDGERDSCQGDSGGPAVINGKLAGIVSFGYECATKNFPGVYTQVANYIDWIKENTGLKL